MFGFLKVWMCVCVGFVMCGCVYVWVFVMCVFCNERVFMCGFFNLRLCVCVGSLRSGYVYVCVL